MLLGDLRFHAIRQGRQLHEAILQEGRRHCSGGITAKQIAQSGGMSCANGYEVLSFCRLTQS
jgi:hypothetical protein